MQYVPVSPNEIIAEYTAACAAEADYAKAKWGSAEGMRHRFQLAIDQIDWSRVTAWLDIGCGAGGLFAEADAAQIRVAQRVGVDLTPEMIATAQQRAWDASTRYCVADLADLPAELGRFDCITMIGVLQQCGLTPQDALAAAVARLSPGGQLFLTTKNLAWDAFTTGGLTPEPSHSWFMPEELIVALAAADMQVHDVGGLLPREGRVVPLTASHTLFIRAEKSGGGA